MALLILGLELATGTLGESLGRIRGVAEALAAGEGVEVYLPAYFAGVLAICIGFAGLAVSAWSRLIRGRLKRGTACPGCGSGTRRIRRKTLHRFLAGLVGEKVQRRICTECEWKGLIRVR